MKVLINMWPGFLSRRSGDFCAPLDVVQMRLQYPDMEFVFVDSLLAQLSGNARAVLLGVLHRLHIRNQPIFTPIEYLKLVNYLPSQWVRKVKPDAIFAQTLYPWFPGLEEYPLVVQQYFASERHMQLAGTLDRLPMEIRAKRWSTRHARAFLTYMPSSKERIERYIPESRGKVRVAPLYMPYVEPAPESAVIAKHRTDGPLRVLFVGGEARRKGLQELMQAMTLLEPSIRRKLQLTVVSKFRDGEVEMDPETTVLRQAPVAEVLRLMRAAHVFVLPTHFDSFGRVVIEAMANGCATVSTAADPQDWMLDYGRCGICVDPTSAPQIAAALTRLASDETDRTNIAIAGLARFRDIFYHRVVAAQYRAAFESAQLS